MKIAVVISVAFTIAVIAWVSAGYYIEEARQESTMMKACVDAGNSWYKNWRNAPVCTKENPR